MHKSVGAIIKRTRNGKEEILLMDRKIFPFGWACPAGHIEKNETPENALMREVKEEIGLKITKFNRIFNEYIPWNECSRGERGHYWYVYEIKSYAGSPNMNELEAKDQKWIPIKELKDINLEEVWAYWFKKLSLLDQEGIEAPKFPSRN